MYRMFLIGLLMIGLLSTGGLAGTAALFTDTQAVGANTFTTGTLDLTASPATAIVTFSAMAPGDNTVGAVTVTNGGTLQMRYAISSATTEKPAAVSSFSITPPPAPVPITQTSKISSAIDALRLQ